MKTKIILALSILILSAAHFIFIDWTCDDAYISIRYAQNLAEGRGLVFNHGELVEGYSNFLWVLAASGLSLLSIPVVWGIKILSFIFSLGILWLLWRTAEVYGVGKTPAAMSVLTMSFSTSLAVFAMSGMETVFYAFLLLLAVYLERARSRHDRPSFAVFAVLLAASLTRPEGILFLMIGGVHVIIQELVRSGARFRLSVLLPPAVFSILYAGFLAVRYLVYGDFLPNTFFAKPVGTFVEAGITPLFANLSNAFLAGSYLLLPIIVLALIRRAWGFFALPLLFCFAQLLFMSYAGDWMAFGRFFMPILPIVILLVFGLSDLALRRKEDSGTSRLKAGVSAVILLVFAAANITQAAAAMIRRGTYPYLVMKADQLEPVADWLNDRLPKIRVISVRRQGYIPYQTGLRSIDLLGLTDKAIARIYHAHRKLEDGNPAFREVADLVIREEPDVIVLFASLDLYTGHLYDPRDPSFQLEPLEKAILERALTAGFRIDHSMRIGEREKALFLAQQPEQGQELSSRTDLERNSLAQTLRGLNMDDCSRVIH